MAGFGRSGEFTDHHKTSIRCPFVDDRGAQPASLNRPLTKVLEEPFHQVLPLNHEMAEFVLLCSCHFPPQGWQVVSQEVPQKDALTLRKE